jgi:RNA polymerase sigma-70 factor (ECF subfamily)
MTRGIDAEAFDRLYTEHAAGLLGFLTYQTGDRTLAEDIVADTFERVLTSRSGWRGKSGEKTWLYAIAMNRLRDLARRRGAETRALERAAAVTVPADEFGAVSDRDLLRRGLLTLSEEERAVVALRCRPDAQRDRRRARGTPEHRRRTPIPRPAKAARQHELARRGKKSCAAGQETGCSCV